MANLKTWLQQLFGASQKKSAPEIPMTFIREPEETPPVPATELPSGEGAPCSGKFSVGWQTDVGRVRGHNEDALFVFTGEQDASNATPSFGLFVLADGMGGHQAGEVASSLAVRIVSAHLISQVYMPLLSGLDRGADQQSLVEVMREAITQANRLVTQDLPGSGSTLTCGLVLGDRLFVGHVGDSRAYLWRAAESFQQITHDHSLVNRLIEIGQLTEEEAATHPQRNVLYRAIGQGGGLEVDISTSTLQGGDSFLLCTDGLWGMLGETEIARLIANEATPHEACRQLVNAANAAGGNDNISVILVKIWQGQD